MELKCTVGVLRYVLSLRNARLAAYAVFGRDTSGRYIRDIGELNAGNGAGHGEISMKMRGETIPPYSA